MAVATATINHFATGLIAASAASADATESIAGWRPLCDE
jgi:hypothetical protein